MEGKIFIQRGLSEKIRRGADESHALLEEKKIAKGEEG